MKTKKMVYAKMRMLQEISQQLKYLEEDILQQIHTDSNAVFGNVTKELQALVAGDRTLDEAFRNMDSCFAFDNMEEGEDVILPSIKIRHGGDMIDVSLATKYGDSVDATICYADNYEAGSVQASIGYTINKGKTNELPIDLALAEVKRGELAKVNELPRDNKDIDIYLWTDPYTNEYTNMYRIKHTDVLEALKECEG